MCEQRVQGRHMGMYTDGQISYVKTKQKYNRSSNKNTSTKTETHAAH